MIKGLEGDADRETAGGPLLGTLLKNGRCRRAASGKKKHCNRNIYLLLLLWTYSYLIPRGSEMLEICMRTFDQGRFFLLQRVTKDYLYLCIRLVGAVKIRKMRE